MLHRMDLQKLAQCTVSVMWYDLHMMRSTRTHEVHDKFCLAVVIVHEQSLPRLLLSQAGSYCVSSQLPT